MKVVAGYPPNYEEVKAKFNPGPRTVFTYGDTVYVPSGNNLPADLEAHEAVHILQQMDMGAEAWWRRYIDDAGFRAVQEIEAYKAQWKFAQANYSRQDRRRLLRHITADLSGPMYGNLVDRATAKELIIGTIDTPHPKYEDLPRKPSIKRRKR